MRVRHLHWRPCAWIALLTAGIIAPIHAADIKTAKPVYARGQAIQIQYSAGEAPPAKTDELPDFSEPAYTVAVSWDIRVSRVGTPTLRKVGTGSVPAGHRASMPTDARGQVARQGWATLRVENGLEPGDYEARLFKSQFALGLWPKDKPHPDAFVLLATHRFRVEGAPTYTYAPALALEAACFPRKPVPNAPMCIGVRIQNHGSVATAGVVLELEFMDPHLRVRARELKSCAPFCRVPDKGPIRCALGDIASDQIVDLAFTARAPGRGRILWQAVLTSRGNLAGPTRFGGMLGEIAPPSVVDVVVLADQKAFENTVPKYAYPTGMNAGVGTSRYLLVVGHNLPQKPDDKLELGSPDPDIHYVFTAFPDTKNPVHAALFQEGWTRLYEMEDQAAAAERAARDGYDALLVRADLKQNILPGGKTVQVQGAAGHWALQFGGLSASMAFVRQVDLKTGTDWDILRQMYWPGRVRVAVQTNCALPLDAIPVILDASDLSAQGKKEIRLTARRTKANGPRIYLSEPLDIHGQRTTPFPAGGIGVPVDGRRPPPLRLRARVEERFIYEKFLLPIMPAPASVLLRTWPAGVKQECLWHQALSRVARAHKQAPPEWKTLSRKESESVSNVIVFHLDRLKQSITFGQHAAAILLRDTFVSTIQPQLDRFRQILTSKEQVEGLLRSMRPQAMDDSLPLNRMEVQDPKGRKTTYRYVILNDPPFLAKLYGKSKAAIEAWQIEQTQMAVERLIKAMEGAMAVALAIDDDEVEDLVMLTGFDFEPMARLLKAELVRREKHTLPDGSIRWVWVPDLEARGCVDSIAPLAAALREQQRRADIDNDMCMNALSLVTLPFMFSERLGVALFCLAIDLLDLGLTTTQELSQYISSQTELKFALGASVLIGVKRYDEAVQQAKGWMSTTFGIGVSAGGVFMSVVDLVHLATIPRRAVKARIARGRLLTTTVKPKEVTALARVDLRDLVAFAINAYAKGKVHGIDSLTALEREAIVTVHDMAKASPPRVSEPPLPLTNPRSAFAPSEPIRFEADMESGATRVVPGRGDRVVAPSAGGGEAANAVKERVPQGCQITVRAEDGTTKRLSLGTYIAEGSFNEVFRHAEFPEAWVIRLTNRVKVGLGEADVFTRVDDFGWEALASFESRHIRAAKVKETYWMTGELRGGRVRVVEALDEKTMETIVKNEGVMTASQMMALSNGLADLNRRGFVFLDLKADNIELVQIADRWEVVVLDPGGIIKVRSPELARKIQLMVCGDFDTSVPGSAAYSWLDRSYRPMVRKQAICEALAEEAIQPHGIDIAEIFNPRLAEQVDPRFVQMFTAEP